MIAPSEFLKYLLIFGVPFGGGGGGGVTAQEVQEFAFNYSPSTGVNDAFVVNLDPAVTTLTDGLIVSMSSGALTNLTAAPTLQVNALAAKDIVLWSGAVAPGDIEPNGSYLFIYDGANDNFQLINPSVSTANAFFVQDNAYNTGIDTGAADAYNVTLLIDPPMPFSPGFPIYLQVGAGNTNTGASTITVNGDTDPVVNPDGSALNAGSLVAQQTYQLVYNSNYNAWVLVNSSFPQEGSGGLQNVQIFTGNGTWNKPTNFTDRSYIEVWVIGGGGGSGGCGATSAGQAAESGGGGAGGVGYKRINSAALGASETVTVGAPGAAGVAGNNPGGAGGTSSFGAHLSCTGGGGGNGMPSALNGTAAGGTPGVSTGSDIGYESSTGRNGLILSGIITYAGQGGGNAMAAPINTVAVGVGNLGRFPGGGASGSNNPQSQPARVGAMGASGLVIVKEYY